MNMAIYNFFLVRAVGQIVKGINLIAILICVSVSFA